MHDMQTIATHVRGVCLSVCPSVSLSVTRLNSAARAVSAAHSLQPSSNYLGLLFTCVQAMLASRCYFGCVRLSVCLCVCVYVFLAASVRLFAENFENYCL